MEDPINADIASIKLQSIMYFQKPHDINSVIVTSYKS